MTHIKTFYQLYDNEKVVCCIDDVLVSLEKGSEVWVGANTYIVSGTVDVVKDYNTVYRSIWLVESADDYGNEEE